MPLLFVRGDLCQDDVNFQFVISYNTSSFYPLHVNSQFCSSKILKLSLASVTRVRTRSIHTNLDWLRTYWNMFTCVSIVNNSKHSSNIVDKHTTVEI